MMRIQLPSIEKLSLGYRFDRDREVVSLIFINYFIILLFIVIVFLLHSSDEELVLVSYRYHLFILICIIDLLLIRARHITLAKVLILTLTPILILILPPLGGVFDNEFYFWFPYVPIALSLIPHFILHAIRNRIALIIILCVYFLLVLLIDNYLIFLSDGSDSIIPFVIEIRFYYNLIPAVIYIFVNLAIGLLFFKNIRYEIIMRKQQNDLIQAEKMTSLGTFTAGIAHEINNPLNFISGSLHALNTLKEEYIKQEEEISPEREALTRQMDHVMESSFEGVKRATDIISSLKFFASPIKGVKTVNDLEQLFDAALQGIETNLPGHITLTKQIQPGLKIHCYQEPIQQVFSNILNNAIEAIESKTKKGNEKIHISVMEQKIDQNPMVKISIRNSGPTIPEKDIKQVFDPFFTSREANKSTGLSLPISYMIIGEHGGKIELQNKGMEVEVEVVLPLVANI